MVVCILLITYIVDVSQSYCITQSQAQSLTQVFPKATNPDEHSQTPSALTAAPATQTHSFKK